MVINLSAMVVSGVYVCKLLGEGIFKNINELKGTRVNTKPL